MILGNQVLAGLLVPLLIGVPAMLSRFSLYYSTLRTGWFLVSWVTWAISCTGFLTIILFWDTDICFLNLFTGASASAASIAGIGVGFLAWCDGRKPDPSPPGRRAL